MRERLRDMLQLASGYVKQFGYDKDIDVETFLAEYRLLYAVGFYASQRYFEDFSRNGVFQKHVSGKTFRIDEDQIKRFATLYKVEFPKGEENEK